MSRAYRDLIAKTLDDRLGAPIQDYRGPLTEEKGGGLKRPGKPSLLQRVGFLLRAVRDDRSYQAGLGLEARKRGGKLGGGRRRSGSYSNAYAKGPR